MKQEEFYKRCSFILKRILKKEISLKNACYNTSNPKQYFVVLKSVLDNLSLINDIYNKLTNKKEKYITFIKIYEIIVNKCKLKDDFYKEIKNLTQEIKLNKKIKKVFYFRINNLKKVKIDINYEETDIKGVYKTEESIDHNLIKDGKVIIQNYSSCLPAYFLNPNENSVVLDCCAAPGNKTSHLSQIMNDKGKIIAVEKDKKRFKVLNDLIKKGGYNNIVCINDDSLSVDINLYEEVEYVLIDPSCSGSGLHSIYKKNKERLKKLQFFQMKLLNYFLRLRNIKKAVYSTCSIHEEENEEVVKNALENNPNFKLEKINVLRNKGGNKNYSFADEVIRIETNEEENITGFFVALFVRK